MTFAVTVDVDTGEYIHDPVNSLIVLHYEDHENIVFLINSAFHDNKRMKYKVKDLDGFHDRELDNGWFALRFSNPRHMLVMHTQSSVELHRLSEWFIKPLLKILSYNKSLVLDQSFDPKLFNYMGVERFDRRSMDMGGLSTIVLEDIFVPSLPVSFGYNTISYISFSRSTLGLSTVEPDPFWNWMSTPTICGSLKVLELNSNGLEGLPCEMIFLKELTTLSVSKNKLTFIPHFIGELKKLRSLFVDDNKLRYLPECLQTRTFQFINYSNNDFESFNELLKQQKSKRKWKLSLSKNAQDLKPSSSSSSSVEPNEKLYSCVKLSLLSLFCLINNDVKFKREDLSLAVIKQFDMLFRCAACHKLMIADKDDLYIHNYARSKCFTKTEVINWQYFKCNYKCIDIEHTFSRILS